MVSHSWDTVSYTQGLNSLLSVILENSLNLVLVRHTLKILGVSVVYGCILCSHVYMRGPEAKFCETELLTNLGALLSRPLSSTLVLELKNVLPPWDLNSRTSCLYSVMVRCNCQLNTPWITWEESLNERLSKLDCPVGISVEFVFIKSIDLGRPATVGSTFSRQRILKCVQLDKWSYTQVSKWVCGYIHVSLLWTIDVT